jgi:hypothetical protein
MAARKVSSSQASSGNASSAPSSLPPRPNLDQLKHQAKDLLKSHRAGNARGCVVLRRLPKLADVSDAGLLAAAVTLNDAQFALAKEYGFENWEALKRHVEAQTATGGIRKDGNATWIEGVPVLRWGQRKDCTFAAGLESATAVSSRPFSYVDFMAGSALAFRTRWHEGRCPSCTVGEMPEEANAVRKTTGWHIGWKTGAGGADMERFTGDIRQSLDAGMPVLVYPPDLNIAVAYGYADEGRVLLLRDYMHGDRERRIPVRELGFLLGFLTDRNDALPEREALAFTLRLAILHWKRGIFHEGPADYFYGVAAYRRWADDLGRAASLSEEDRRKLFFLTWLNFNTIVDARATAETYLREKARSLGGEPGALLDRAAALYARQNAHLGGILNAKDAFLGPWSRRKFEDWTEEVRQRERDCLDAMSAQEAEAVLALEKALASLESAKQREEQPS